METEQSDQVLQFVSVFHVVRGERSEGTIKISPKGFAFKSKLTSVQHTVQKSDLVEARWTQVALGCQARFQLKTGEYLSFDGFKLSDYTAISGFFTTHAFPVTIEKSELNVSGHNYGLYEFEGPHMAFKVNTKTAFEIPLGAVSNATATKNEAAIDFREIADSEKDSQIVESMRFVLTNGDELDADSGRTMIAAFVEQILAKADVAHTVGDSMCTFTEVNFATPRGRYDVEFFAAFLRMHGKTFDYKIPYDSISRHFMLPKPDQQNMYIVLALDPPLRQGNLRYPFTVMQFPLHETTQLAINFSIPDCDKFASELQSDQEAPTYDHMARILSATSKRRTTKPPTDKFQSAHGDSAITCSHKANDGFLYPLERGFLFVHKPVIHLRFEDISGISFARVKSDSSSRSFDLEIELKNGAAAVEFKNLQRAEYEKLYSFIDAKGLRILNLKEQHQARNRANLGDSDDEGDFDPYMNRIKADAQEEEAANRQGGDDDDESDDEDFQAGDSSSSAAEEYDSNPDTTDSDSGSGSEDGGKSGSGSDDEEKAPKEKKEKKKTSEKPKSKKSEEPKPKKPAAEAQEKRKRETSDGEASGSESDDEGDGGAKKGKAKRAKKEKDPNAPKRPNSGYMLWLAANRERIKAENPGIKVTDIAKKGGEVWKTLSADEKETFESQSKKDWEVYRVAAAKYEEEHKNDPKPAPKPPTTTKAKAAPKEGKPKKDLPKGQQKLNFSKSTPSTSTLSKEFIDSDDDAD
eukprot:m.616714 g.616714  ORF g.616714 m.616714 type:complete len:749 (+) comp58169_c0_seq1:118-2364(+)